GTGRQSGRYHKKRPPRRERGGKGGSNRGIWAFRGGFGASGGRRETAGQFELRGIRSGGFVGWREVETDRGRLAPKRSRSGRLAGTAGHYDCIRRHGRELLSGLG